MSTSQITICALYKFVRLENFQALRAPLLAKMESLDVKGTLLLANEGINGTIAGSHAAIEQVLQFLAENPSLSQISYKVAFNDENPFHRTKVKLKKKSSPWVLKVSILIK